MLSNPIQCDVCKFIDKMDPKLTICSNKDWIANLRPNDQTLLGTCVIVLKRHRYDLDQLTAQEHMSLFEIQNSLMYAIRTSFQPITFNISCLKNDAFKADPDHTSLEAAHVHWHVKPRYGSRPKRFEDTTFTDPMPRQYLTSYPKYIPPQELLYSIARIIRAAIN